MIFQICKSVWSSLFFCSITSSLFFINFACSLLHPDRSTLTAMIIFKFSYTMQWFELFRKKTKNSFSNKLNY